MIVSVLLFSTAFSSAFFCLREVKEKKRKEAEEKKKKAPAAKPAGAQAKASEKMGKTGGANLKPARISAPGKQGAR